MEELLHYVWKHKLFALKPLQTTDGQPIEIIDPGLANMHAGPDFSMQNQDKRCNLGGKH